MPQRFDWFVVFAEMRTGSNFLEANLNALPGVTCLGEAFNPHFIGYPNRSACLGVGRDERDRDPARLLAAIRGAEGLAGFRYFHDHDPRVLDAILDDPRCAKIVLTRNPLDSYLSWKIAQATGQWKLTDVQRRRGATATFDAREFEGHLAALQGFQLTVLNRLQAGGQTAFYLDYDDLQSLAALNGLAQWLGAEGRLEVLDRSLKPQNPTPAAAKVSNPEAMERALAGLDRFNLGRTPNFEPRRGPSVPTHVAGAETPLLFLPVPGAPGAEVTAWMAALDGVAEEDLPTAMTQKRLRQWKRGHPGHRSFTVLRHPVARAHAVFCARILAPGPGGFAQIRETLRRQFKLPLPDPGAAGPWPAEAHRAAFEGFLDFVKASLAGQTAIRVDPHWMSQAQLLGGFAEFSLPDRVLREEELATALPQMATDLGHPAPPPVRVEATAEPVTLAQIYDAELERRVASVYARDYMSFGFGPWR